MQKIVILMALIVGLLTFPIHLRATTPTVLVVDDDEHGSATNCDASDTAFTTIQDAINSLPDVPPNHLRRLILVCPGTYNTGGDGRARVGIGINSIAIVSTDGPGKTMISGAFRYGFLINAHRVVIQGFTVIGGQLDGQVFNNGIFIYGGHENGVLGNVVRGALTVGICIGSDKNTVNGNRVHNNENGIIVGSTDDQLGCENNVDADDNIITNNTVRNNNSTGILVFSNTRNNVIGNDIHDNATGIAISPEPEPKATFTFVAANRVHDNDTGIVEQGNNTRCDGNNIRHNHVNFDPRGNCSRKDNQLNYVH